LYISPALPCARRKNDPRARACWRLRRLRGSRAPRCPHVMPCCPRLRATCPPHASHPLQHLCAVKSTPGAGLETTRYISDGRKRHCMDVAWMLHGCCMDAAWMLHECCMDVAWMLHGCRRDASRHAHAARRGRGAGAAAAPTGRALSPTLFSSLSHTISISHLCERACGDVWRTRRTCSGEFIRQGAPKSPQQPAQKQPARRSS